MTRRGSASAYREAVTYYRAGPHGPAASPRQSRPARAGHRCPARPAHCAHCAWRLWTTPRPTCARPKPWPRPCTITAGSGGSPRIWPFVFSSMGDQEQSLASSQRALALAEALGDVVLQVRANAFSWVGSTTPWATIVKPSSTARRGVAHLEGDLLRERFGLVFLPAVNARVVLVECLAEVGAFTEGRAIGTEGLQIAEAVDHPVQPCHCVFQPRPARPQPGGLPRGCAYARTEPWTLPRPQSFCSGPPGLPAALGSAYALLWACCGGPACCWSRRWSRRPPCN